MHTLYRPIHTIYTSPDGDVVSTYGIEVYTHRGVTEITDIDLCADAVRRLIDRLHEQAVEGCHLRDVVEDYIGERAGG